MDMGMNLLLETGWEAVAPPEQNQAASLGSVRAAVIATR